MAYLLRGIIFINLVGIFVTALKGFNLINISLNHIQLALFSFTFLIFAEAFVMFYFIGVSRFVNNIAGILGTETNLDELFDQPPQDLTPYSKETAQHQIQTTLYKRKVIAWTMLTIILGMLAFFLGAAFDTGHVDRTIHSGVVYGFAVALLISSFHQWKFLKKNHLILRKIKALFSIPDHTM